MTEDECVAIGGHCWEERGAVVIGLMSYPSQYTRRCKHCGKEQRGVAQPTIKWSNADSKEGSEDGYRVY